MDIYSLYRNIWDFAFENPDKIKPNHIAVFSFAIEHCNRLGWKKKFGFPTSMVLEATGIKSYSVFKKTFDELVVFGFIQVIEYSKNQYSSNVIALKENCKALDKALDKALAKHLSKQVQSTGESTGESIVTIDRQLYNNTNIQDYKETKAVSKSNDFDHAAFLIYWNNAFENKKVPKIQTMTASRKKAIDSILKSYDKEKIKEAVKKIRASEFLNGSNEKNWNATFDWFFQIKNFTKVFEGNYDNTKIQSTPTFVTNR